jgi:hypothetical protein
MANARNLRRLHFASAERHDTTAPVPPQQNFAEVPPGSVRVKRPAPRIEEGGFVRDRGEYSFRQGPPELAGGWAPGIQRNDTAAFQMMAEHERLVKLFESTGWKETVWPPEPTRRTTSGFAGWLPR